MPQIQAMIFDMDGTLLKTERLKAISYAKAVVKLCPDALKEDAVIEAFKDVVGKSRKEVATTLMKQFNLEDKSKAVMETYGVSSPWQGFVQVRLEIYEEMLTDPLTLKDNQWEHNVELLELANERHCQTALATMSHCEQTNKILKILEWHDKFDFIATRDDVENGKPDPEIYHLVMDELGVSAEQCLIIEDSPAGLEAGLNAKGHVIAVTTPFTKERIHSDGLIDKRFIVDDPAQLVHTVRQFIDDFAR